MAVLTHTMPPNNKSFSMKTRKFFSIALLPLLMLTLQHCDKNDPKPLTELEKLPPATQSGKRTFGCLVDGKAWVIEQITDVSAFYQTGTFGMYAGITNKLFYSVMSIHIDDQNLSETTYQLSEVNGVDSEDARYFDHRTSCEYLTGLEYGGTVTITHIDKINFIISGTFEFEAYSEDCTKVVKVSDGRFDVHYAP